MTGPALIEAISGIVGEILPGAGADPDASLLEVGLDSIGMVTLLNEVESRLGVAIPAEYVLPENFASVRAIAALADRVRS